MNPFDKLSGIDDYEMGSLSKKLKKAGKKVDSARRKVLKKTLGKKLYEVQSKVGKEIKRNPIAAAVVITAVSAMASPAVGMALRAGLTKAAAAAKAVKGAITAKKIVSGAKAISAVASAAQKAKAAKTEKEIAKQSAAISASIEQKTPEFNQLAQTMAAQGYSDADIMKTWAQSQSYVDTTRSLATQQYSGAVADQLVSQGYNPVDAERLAPEIAGDLGERAALEVQEKSKSSAVPFLIGGGLLLSMLLR